MICTATRNGEGVPVFSQNYGSNLALCSISGEPAQIQIKVSCIKTGLEAFSQ